MPKRVRMAKHMPDGFPANPHRASSAAPGLFTYDLSNQCNVPVCIMTVLQKMEAVMSDTYMPCQLGWLGSHAGARSVQAHASGSAAPAGLYCSPDGPAPVQSADSSKHPGCHRE